MTDDDELTRRLNDLFTGPGLDLVPRPGATGAVLGRVRQARRRRRAVRTAAPILVATGLIGIVVATQAGGDRLTPPPPAGTTPPTMTATVPPDAGEPEMKHAAVGTLRLGMTAAQAEATGLLDPSSRTPDAEKPDCTRYAGRHGVIRVAIGRFGVSDIQVYPFIHTPQGIGVGDRFTDLRAAYPAAVPATPDSRSRYRVPVPGVVGAWYAFRLEDLREGQATPAPDSRIAEVGLVTNDHSCD